MGSHFIRHLYRKYPGYRIINLDLLTYAGNKENLRDIEEVESSLPEGEKRYDFIKGDICDHGLVGDLFKKNNLDFAINFAAETHVDRSIMNLTDFVKTNFGGVRVLAEAARDFNLPKFLHISTDEVYGDVTEGRAAENYPLKPSSPYAASKAAADLLLKAFMRTYKTPIVIIRGTNNYGSHQYPEKLIPLSVSNLIEGKKIPIHGNGLQVRSWLHVSDFCEAIDMIAHRAPAGEIYNVSGEERTNLQMLEMIARVLGKDPESYKEYVSDRPGGDSRYSVDDSKLRKTLGWLPKRDPENSIEEVVNWYLSNQEWWKSLKKKKEYTDHYEKQSKGQWY